ncbi:MAG: NAD(P)/FAD-dependent oxidoreductase [Methanomassiliicoccaceae archaeon]|nr:NAD(P)/FAD-dependent oxidoreductase [Methanomassiliicoccaceae archaeon]
MNADVVIIGCGPAGLQAGIHSSRKKADTVIVGKPGNSALQGAHVENYFGLAGKADGRGLLAKGLEQAVSFGCRHLDMNVTGAEAADGGFLVTVESGEAISCRSVVIATGISRAKLGIPGEEALLGKGVSYCAECDCGFYKGLRVAVIGDESEAAVSAELMTRYASEVHWVSRGVSADRALVDRATAAGASIVSGAPKEIRGGGKVESLLLEDGREVAVDGVFIVLGGRSSAYLAMDLGVTPEPDDSIRTDEGCETSVPGVFACGDVTGKPWQLAKAVGEGAVAGLGAAARAKGQI